MPNRDGYAQGTPSWVDLMTTDTDGAQAFYAARFGWEWGQDDTDDPEHPYWMAALKGRSAAGMMRQSQEQVELGIPPTWNAYLTVDDCDAACARVTELGGQVLMPGMDSPPGRMAAVADPLGAVFSIIELANRPE